MDYLRSYSNLLDQSRFYFSPLTSLREAALSDQRPSSVTADVLGGPPMPSAAAITPLIMLHGARGLTRGEREIPLDLSLKTIRQTPDSTADADVLNQQLVAARSHALQMAEALAIKKFSFSPLEMTSAASGATPQLRDRFLTPPAIYSAGHHLAPPPSPLIRPLASVTPTSGSLSLSSSTTASSVASGFSRGPTTSSDSGAGSAFVAPHTAMHAAICGGLNGFCLDPRRCRLAATATSSGSASPSNGNESYQAAASAFRAYAAALYEQCHKKPSTSSTTSTTTSTNVSQSAATGALQGLADVHMSMPSASTANPASSTSSSISSNTTNSSSGSNCSASSNKLLMTSSTSSISSTTSSSSAIKNPFPVTFDGFFHGFPPLPPYHLRPPHSHSSDTTYRDHHNHHNHSNRLSKDPNCACCNVAVTKPYPLPCVCCFPAVTPSVAHARGVYDALFGCCPPSTTVPVVIPSIPSFGSHTPTTPSSSETKTKSSRHHHHHHHHHHRHEKSSEMSTSPSVNSKHNSNASDSKKAISTPVSASEFTKEDNKSRLPSSPSPSVSIKQPSPPEGGRWIPHLHSNQSEKMNTASRPTGSESNVKGASNKVFAPVVRIPPSPPEGVFQGPTKTPSPHVNTASVLPLPLPPSPAINRPTAFTAVYPSRPTTMLVDVITPAPKRHASVLDGSSQRSGSTTKKTEGEGRDNTCSPPKIAKVSAKSTNNSKELERSNSNGQWTQQPSSGSSSPVVKENQAALTSIPDTSKVKREKIVLNRVWEANYLSDNVRQVPVVLSVTPMEVLNEIPNAPTTKSPVEACLATAGPMNRKTPDTAVDDERAKMASINEAASPTTTDSEVRSENVVSPLVIKAATSVAEQEKSGWKRVALEPANCSSPAKKMKKKDVIVISMKDEHQISTNLVMKSVKRKLEDPKGQSNGIVNSPSNDGPRSSPVINHYKLAEVKQLTTQSLPSEIQASTIVHTASLVTTTTTTTTARFTNCQPEVVTQQDNHQTSDDKNSILRLSVKILPGINNNSVSGKLATSEEKLPVVGITLTKTGGDSGPTALYKSSMLQTSSNSANVLSTTSSTTSCANEFSPAINSTAAMLRRYYEDQKLRLQQAEEFNRLRFTKGNNPLTNAPLKDTLASSSSSSTRPSPPITVTSITTSSIDTKPKAAAVTVTTSLPAVISIGSTSKQSTTSSTSTKNFLPKAKQREDEAADDGDDEREDDDEEDDEDEDDDDDDYEDDDDDDEDYESDEGGRKTTSKDSGRRRSNNAELRSQVSNKTSHSSNGVSTCGESKNSNTIALGSGLVVTSTNHRNDNNSKRVMYNKALGETMLHRAARLGQMDHLKYYLETQSSTIDARDNAGYTPLHECCSRGHIEAARMLLQHGADVNSAAAGGVRPIHDAVENDYLEVVRLLLSYGADPLITTYSGLTPLKLAKSPAMLEFFKGFLADVSGECVTPILPWQFRGSAKCFDPKPSGYDPLEELPSEDEHFVQNQNNSGDDCDVDDDAALIFEVSDKPHIPTYHVPATRRNGSGILSFCLFHDVLNQTGMTRSAFHACYPDIQVERIARQEFLSQAKCTQIMVDTSAALKANCPPSIAWVELLRWDSNLRDILDIERVSIPTAVCKPESSS